MLLTNYRFLPGDSRIPDTEYTTRSAICINCGKVKCLGVTKVTELNKRWVGELGFPKNFLSSSSGSFRFCINKIWHPLPCIFTYKYLATIISPHNHHHIFDPLNRFDDNKHASHWQIHSFYWRSRWRYNPTKKSSNRFKALAIPSSKGKSINF